MSDRSSSAVGVSRSLCTPQGPAYEVPIQLFLQYVLPPLPRGLEVAQIISELTSIGKKSSLQKPITLKGRWRGFPVDPSSSKDPDRMSFRNLPSVFHSILKAGSTKANRLRACLQFQNNAACAPRPLDKSICTLPDAFWFRGTQCSWSTIAVSGELRKGQSSADEMDNVTKITSSMSNCMRTDPRRRFTFGFTIENTNMKLWFCDRSQILFTTPFNFISDREYLVHFCLAVAYAHPNQLGWDPTMVPTNQHGQYDITVYTDDGLTRVYRTLQLISDSGAQTIRGRGTRVWKVVRVEDGEEHGEPMVLKDTWVDTNRRREGTTLDEIRNAERIPDHQVFVDRIFLTREWDGDVFQDAARTIIDSTPDFTPSPDDLPQSPRMSTPSASGSTSVEQRAVVPKVHYRIVFKEVCKPVHSETSLRKIFVALAQTAAGLQLMHQAGWVHRDISTGNILLGEDGTARLMDLEYTRKAGTGDESLLGTAKFIAVEVERQDYLFPTPRPIDSPASDRSETSGSSHHGPKFRYNPLHDLESLWWVATYFIFHREFVLETKSPTDGGVSDAQRVDAARLFDSRVDRMPLIISNAILLTKSRNLHPSLDCAVSHLQEMRQALYAFYVKTEANLDSIDYAHCADGLHSLFMESLMDIAENGEYKYVKLRPFTPASAQRPRAVVDGPSASHDGNAQNQQRPPAEEHISGGKRKYDPSPDAAQELPEKALKRARTTVRKSAAGSTRTRPYLARGVKVQACLPN